MAEEKYWEKTSEATEECRKTVDVWRKQKEDYERLYDRLESLPQKLTHDIMVPIGSVGLMPGRIVHGNEILVLLGDNWFLECPCSHALGIVKRRINYCDDRIKDFTDELQLYENCLKLKGTLVPEQEGLVEIKEDFDTEAEAKWKQQRKEKLKATKKQEESATTDSALKAPAQVEQKDFDALLKRLDELEKLEKEDEDEESSANESPTASNEDSSDEEKTSSDEKSQKKTVRWTNATTKTFDKEAKVEELVAGVSTEPPPQLIANEESEFSSMPKSILKPTDYEAPKNLTFPSDLELLERPKVILPGSASAFTGEIVERNADAQPEASKVEVPSRAKMSKFKMQKLRKL